jgi:uncharacterized protein (TIGR03790 family)
VIRALALSLLLVLAGSVPARADPPPAPPGAPATAAESHPEVLILVNEKAPVSLSIGEAYRRARGIPEANVLRLSLRAREPGYGGGLQERVPRALFDERIREPVERFLREHDLVDRIEVIVTTKGLPFLIQDPKVQPRLLLRDSKIASVEAELALLFSKVVGSPGAAHSPNPYLGVTEPFASWPGRGKPLRYLVARLDGYQDDPDPATGVPKDVGSLIDAARAEGPGGPFVVDEDPMLRLGYEAGDRLLLQPTAAALAALGLPVQRETTAAPVADAKRIAGLATWGSNASDALKDPGPPYFGTIAGRLYPGTFGPRALTVALVSFDGRTFTSPPRYGQSLAADLIHLGAAGAAAHASEPTLSGVAKPYLLLREYALGTKAVEAFYRSVPYLGWTNVYVGDPLMTISHPVAARPDDQDGDGVPDARDDCRDIPNPDQRDTDGDGYGNLCDADLDGDGWVSTSWGLPDRPGDVERIALTARAFGYDADQDLDGDGKVDVRDVSLAYVMLLQRPGPGVPGLHRPANRAPTPAP